MTSTRLTGWCGVAAALLLAACASSTDLSAGAAPVETRTPEMAGARSATSSGATSSGTASSSVASVDLASRHGAAATADAMNTPEQRVIYFDFDSSEIQDRYKPVIDGHARWLSASPRRRIVIEGHTDERGGREYNLALGQKRAETVAHALELLGAADGQIEAVSFGAEHPADAGHDEAAWAKNRRAELKDH
jgi:peptidoglycan-associated lipoprotein